MKKTRRTMAGLLSAGLIVGLTAASHAFTTQGSITKAATATTVGTGSVSMNVTVRQLSDNAPVTDVAWTGVTLPTGWKNADDYIQLDSTMSASNGGIRIVTSNKDSGAVPLYTGASTSTAAGLVDSVDTTKTLAMAWTIKDNIVGPTGPTSAKPYEASDGAGQTNQFQWLFMTDTAQTTPDQGAAYRTAVNITGIHFGGGDLEFGAAASPNFVYLEANFATAVTPRTYSTNRLIVEAFLQ